MAFFMARGTGIVKLFSGGNKNEKIFDFDGGLNLSDGG